MYGLTTINKLNDQAAEASRILGARHPAADKPAPVAVANIIATRNGAHATIEKILGGARG